ncbi:TPA: hypothetical protein ACPWMT_006452, partial [Pseudomonas aeruginosa]
PAVWVVMWAVVLVGAAGQVVVAVGASAPQGAVPGVCSGGLGASPKGRDRWHSSVQASRRPTPS